MRIHTEFSAPAPTLTILQLCNFYNRHAMLPLLFLLFLSLFFPATAQPPQNLSQPPPPPPQEPFVKTKFNKIIASLLVVLVIIFFTLGFISIFTRQCRERRIRGRIDLTVPINGNGFRQSNGLDPNIIEKFPIFVYSDVKDIKIGRVTLECAVCLNEFGDDETLRLIPICRHVFHRDCIDVWLLHHSTCPVCRADLNSSSSIGIQVFEPSHEGEPGFNQINVIEPSGSVNVDDKKKDEIVNPKVNLDGVNHPVRSESMGFTFARFFSMGHSMVQSVEDCERFTLRLPDVVHNQLINDVTLSRAKSLDVKFQSGRRGYRSRSVGRSFLEYERFNVENRLDQKGFTCNPFLARVGSMRSTKDDNKTTTNVMDEVDVGEHSLSCLISNDSHDEILNNGCSHVK